MRLLQLGFNLAKSLASLPAVCRPPPIQLQATIRENTTFFTRSTADKLWKSVTSVSNPGRRRGRAKGAGRRIAKDLNRGQIMGVGKKTMVWPGLNAPVLRGNEVVEQRELPEDLEYQEKLIQIRDKMDKPPKIKVHPLDRGWSGTRLGGRWVGPPDPVAGEEFTGFDTKVLFMQPVFCMKANFGKTKKMSCLVITGNKKGLAGFAVGKSKDPRTALKRAKNKAGQRLINFQLHEGHTVVHDFFSRFGASSVFVQKKPRGYGLIGTRCLRSVCEAIGITDIHIKTEGSIDNILNLTRAFILGLANQKSFQQMADEKRLYVVEFREDRDNYPVVMAAPSLPCRTRGEISSDEILDFKLYLHDGKVKPQKLVKPAFYVDTKGWETYLKKYYVKRSRPRVRVELLAKHGSVESFIHFNDRKRLEEKKRRWKEQQMKDADQQDAVQQV